jgi:hypothetical protein
VTNRRFFTIAVASGIVAGVVIAPHVGPRPHWETRCVQSYSFVLHHFDYTRGTTLPRYTTFCDVYASVWVGEPGVNVEPTAPADPITFER